MQTLTNTLILCKDWLWGGPLLALLIGVGLYQTWNLKGLQFRRFFHAFGLLLRAGKASNAGEAAQAQPKAQGDLSPFAALMTALAGAIGTGNITGIAVAVSLGGYGTLFWMWVIAFIGMITAYSEVLLAVKFRTHSPTGSVLGGPMQTLTQGLGWVKAAKLFCILGVIASFGIGATIQSHSLATGLEGLYQLNPAVTGLLLALITGLVILGGIHSIGRVAGILVPFMALIYIAAGLVVLGVYHDRLLPAIGLIIQHAFTSQGALGAFAGASVAAALQQGVAIGIFANEAGLGSLAIAASTATTTQPARQGLLALCGVFLATMVICTITGLVIAVTDVLGLANAKGELLSGTPLTMAAFNSAHPNLGAVVIFGLLFFAFTTMLAWAYYGERCLEFLGGTRVRLPYRCFYIAAVFIAVFIEPTLIWTLAHLANGLMAIPNLLSILWLAPVVKAETELYSHTELRSPSEREPRLCSSRTERAGS